MNNKYIVKDDLEEIFTLIKNNTYNNENIDNYSSWRQQDKTPPTGVKEGFHDQIDYTHIKTSCNFYTQTSAGSNEEYKINIAISNTNIGLNYTENYFIYKLYKKFTIEFEIKPTLNDNESRLFVNFDKNLWGFNVKTFSSIGNLDYLIIKIKTFKLEEGEDRPTILIDLIGTSSGGSIAVACGSFSNGQYSTGLNYGIFNKDWWNKYRNYVSGIRYHGGWLELDEELPKYPKPENYSNWNGVYVYIYLKRGCPSYKNMFKDTLVYEASIKDAYVPIDKDYSYMFAGSRFSSWIGWHDYFKTEPVVTMPDGANCTGMFKNCKQLQFINSLSSRQYRQNGTTRTSWTKKSNYGGFSGYACLIDWQGDADWTSMFENCPKLAYVDLDGWKLNKDANIVADNMFAYSFIENWSGVLYDSNHIYGVLRLPSHFDYPDAYNVIKSYYDMLLGARRLNHISFHWGSTRDENIPYMYPYFKSQELCDENKFSKYSNTLKPGYDCITYRYNLISEENVGSLQYVGTDVGFVKELDYIYFINKANSNYPTSGDNFKWSDTMESINFSNTHVCSVCGYVYKDAEGTPWHDVPNTWECPVCGVDKSHFS